MGKTRRKSHLAKVEAQWHKTYSRYRKVYCPALGADVHFTNVGWGHLISNKHTSVEIERRLNLLPYMKALVNMKGLTYVYETRLLGGRPHTYFVLKATVHDIPIVVVISKTPINFIFISGYRDVGLYE